MTSTAWLVTLVALLLGAAIGGLLGWRARGSAPGRSGQEAMAAQAALLPVNHALAELNRSVVGAAREEAAARSALAEQLREMQSVSMRSAAGLQRETRRLVGALSRSDVRGRWGEMQLRRLLETSGLRPGVHFAEQVVVAAPGGAQRPDAIIYLGAQQTVVIDAKVSLAAFLRAEAEDPGPEQEAALAEHAAEVAAHVRRLSAKDYWRSIDSAPDFVVMFLPAEALLAEALARDPGLLEEAFARNVVLATPTTLQALLRTVAHVRRNEEVAENARAIAELGRELHDRLVTMVGHLDRIGAALGSAVQAYNRSVGSFDSRVLVTARKFAEMSGQSGPAGVDGQAQPGTPRMVEVPARWASGGSGPVAPEPTAEFGVADDAAAGQGASITIREPAPAWYQ